MLRASQMYGPGVACIFHTEVGGVGFDPYAVGASGELGPGQLHPHGLLPDYLAWCGCDDPNNPYLVGAYVRLQLEQGNGRHWAGVWLGTC